ncbi:MAG: peroxiredoxin [Planctomycetes bacterium]|nr:peroxiredoxin [Planctomycetota bacterium]
MGNASRCLVRAGCGCGDQRISFSAHRGAQRGRFRQYNRRRCGDSVAASRACRLPRQRLGRIFFEEPHVPNARDISNMIAAQAELVLNDRGMSDYIWAWGQFVDHDISLTLSNPADGTADISVNDPEDLLAPGPLPLNRSIFDPETGFSHNPRQQINSITSFIDASNVYGSDQVRADALRTGEGGRLKTSAGNLPPFNEDGLPNAGGPSNTLFLVGDVRANEQVGLTAMHTLFLREHNRLAGRIVHKFPGATDEEVYQLARKIVGAEMQIITYHEFLPALLGPFAPSLDDYEGFDPDVNPSIANEFSAALFRYGHSTLSPQLLLANNKGRVGTISLRDAFFNPAFLADNPENVDFLLKGFAVQQAQEVDTQVVDDVRSFLFGPPGAGGTDLASLNIQRGRDHGLPLYNVMRVAYGLQPVEDFDEISSELWVQTALELLYGSVDEIDAWIGGLAEDHLLDASVGPLVAAAIIEQFTALRDGDRFFFLNDPDLAHHRLHKIIHLDHVTLADVIRRNTGIRKIQQNVFFIH